MANKDRILIEFTQFDVDALQHAITFNEEGVVFEWEDRTDEGNIIDIDVCVKE
jgi:hypothetical protein